MWIVLSEKRTVEVQDVEEGIDLFYKFLDNGDYLAEVIVICDDEGQVWHCIDRKNIFEETMEKNIIEIKSRNWFNRMTNTFSFEVSSVGKCATKEVWLKNPETGNVVKFNYTHRDMDGSHEDTFGWWYKSECGKFKLLIIND